MNDISIIIAGHSHATCLGVPLQHPQGLTGLLPVPGFAEMAGLSGKWPRDQAYWDELKAQCPGRTVVLLWYGNQHLSRFLLAPEPKMDFVFSGQPGLPLTPGAVIVPEMLLRYLFQPSVAEVAVVIAHLRAAGARHVLLAGTPAPKDDDEFCRSQMNKEPAFAQMAKSLGLELAQMDLSPPLLRCKYWALLQDLMHGVARSQSAGFVPVPKTSLSDKGALAREYWAQDVTHANAEYGELMLKQIATAVAKEAAHASV